MIERATDGNLLSLILSNALAVRSLPLVTISTTSSAGESSRSEKR